MKVTVEYAAQVKRATGVACEDLELPDDCSLQELARTVAETHGAEAARALLDNGVLHRSILVFVDDEQVRDAQTKLNDGQRVTFLSPISGG